MTEETSNALLYFASITFLTLTATLLVVIFLIYIDNRAAVKDEFRYSRNLEIFTEVYAHKAQYAAGAVIKESLAEVVDAWQRKTWIPLDTLIMLIRAGYTPEQVTRQSYREIDFEQVAILVALR